MKLPASITLNAFTGDDLEVCAMLAPDGNLWGSKGKELTKQAPLAPAQEVSLTSWDHQDIGWGVVLADREDFSPKEKARGADAPEAIQTLIGERGNAPVFRYRADLGTSKLARYLEDGNRQDPEIGLTPFGTGKGRLPLYLLICGSPSQIPWRLQYSLNRRHLVGRLDLPEDKLENYVKALRTNWAGMDSVSSRAVIWSVNYDSMTQKMDTTIAKRINKAMSGDAELAITRLEGDAATHSALLAALAAAPSTIVTCSHGKTGPLGDAELMRQTLGLPVDTNRATLDPDTLLAHWSPAGAIWYAQACCSAGSDSGTAYVELLEPDSLADRVTRAVGSLGAAVAPLPTRLLGAAKPLRAFIGHVEPTFDWTLFVSQTGQSLTDALVGGIYPSLYRRNPVGLALDPHYRGVGDLYGKLADARDGVDTLVEGARDDATYYRLTALDRQSLVILGDPTVVLPPLPSQVGSLQSE